MCFNISSVRMWWAHFLFICLLSLPVQNNAQTMLEGLYCGKENCYDGKGRRVCFNTFPKIRNCVSVIFNFSFKRYI